MNELHVIYREDEVILSVDGVPYTVSVMDHRYEDVLEAISEVDFNELRRLLSIKNRASSIFDILTKNEIVSEDGVYYYKGNQIDFDLSKYLISAVNSNTAEPIVKFIKNLFENPNHETRQRLFAFMEHGGLPMTADGFIMAYKVVRSDYQDKHTGTIDNSPGTLLPMLKWSDVDTNNAHTCSRGYHACSIDYLIEGGFYNDGDRVVAVEINPSLVAAVPPDYNDSKLRCTQYEVIEDITDQFVERQLRTRLSAGYGGLSIDEEYEDVRYRRDFY